MTGMSKYYDVFEDIEHYPEAVIIVAYSRRGVGKTYGALKGALIREEPIVYIKRTIEDVNLICSASEAFDTSPYKPINRDMGFNIKPKKIANGVGAFYYMSHDGEILNPVPVAYCVALSAIKNVKGIDLSDCELMIFDEFIPQISETRVLSSEGEALLDVYATVSRDREKRGREPLKLILFANSENLYCPVVEELQIMDNIAHVAMFKKEYDYIEDRAILIHHVRLEVTEEEKTGIYKVMKGTAWFRKSFEGEFSKNDFSNVAKETLKSFIPVMEIKYKEGKFYIYKKGIQYFITKQRSNKCPIKFDLNKDNDIRLFYSKYCLDLQEACMNGRVKFSDYSLYDLITRFDKRFKHVL